VALTELALGASYVLAHRPEAAVEVLLRVLQTFRDCGDSFGRAATRLWLGLAYADLKQSERLASCLDDLLTLCETYHYDFLLTSPTLLGVADIRRVVPLLLSARAQHLHTAYVNRLLTELGLNSLQTHPGYQLRVQMLGHFQVWRGGEEVDAREWKRDKARQLFQLLLIHRGQPLQREAITEQLWPSLSPEAATRDFKVALNALNKTLEPRHETESPFAFIMREGTSYFIRSEADLWLDSAEFEREAAAGLRSNPLPVNEVRQSLQRAVSLYAGDFLAETPYEDWASEERERLLSLYLRAADKLASLYLDQARFDDCLTICQLILNHDTCWERAYRLMMAAHARQGNRPQALRDYQRCVTALRNELNVAPSATTLELYQRLALDGETVVTGL
jgi:DNA-binding SARP family transcriptional activator